MDALSDFLHEQLFFAGLSEEEKKLVLESTFSRSVEAGNYLCRAGGSSDIWYGVITGFVKVSVTSKSGKPMTLVAVAPGGWIGEGSVLKGGPRPYDIVALSASKIACIPRSVFLRLHKSNLGFCHFIIENMNFRLAHFIVSMEIDRLVDPETKVSKTICMLTQGHSTVKPQTLVLNQSELALLCGLSRPFTNRVVMKLTKLGLISHEYGKLTVLDRAGLEAHNEED